MNRLIEGYRLFRENYFPLHRELFGRLAQGQAPKVMIISCCDARVDPGLIFNTAPGETFVFRNVANLVPAYSPDDRCHGTSAAIEFAVSSLNVEHIIVLGHTRCGGIRALLNSHEGDFIGPWMRIAEPARSYALSTTDHEHLDRIQCICEQETIKISLANLRGFPCITARTRTGFLKVHGCYFDIENGELLILDESSGSFTSVT